MLHGLDEGDTRSLHRTRVASRRLREVLPVLQLDPAVVRKLSHRLRIVTSRLGAVRELDVLSMLIDELHETGQHDPRVLQRVGASIAEARARARARLAAKLPTGELQRIAAKLEKVAGRIEDRPPSRAWRWALEARIARRAATLRRAIQDAGSLYLPDRLHAVRIALKKLRYALELSVEAPPAAPTRSKDAAPRRRRRTTPLTPELRSLKHAQDVLGRLHDLQVLVDHVRRLQASLNPPDLTGWRDLEAFTTALENECRHLHARFVHARAEILAVCDRVGAKSTADARRRPAASE